MHVSPCFKKLNKFGSNIIGCHSLLLYHVSFLVIKGLSLAVHRVALCEVVPPIKGRPYEIKQQQIQSSY